MNRDLPSTCWCGERNSVPQWSGRWVQDGRPYALVRCLRCSTIRTWRRSPDNGGEERYFYTQREWRLVRAANYIRSFLTEGTIADIGCNTGILVEALREAGLDAIGFDADGRAVDEGRRFNRRVNVGDVHAAGRLCPQLDAMTFNHTLEHLAHLRQTLQAAHDILRRGGRLFLFVPNIASLRARLRLENWAPLNPHEHVWHFNPKTLLACVTGLTPFRLIDLRTSDLHGNAGEPGSTLFARRLFRKTSVLLGRGEQICAAFEKG